VRRRLRARGEEEGARSEDERAKESHGPSPSERETGPYQDSLANNSRAARSLVGRAAGLIDLHSGEKAPAAWPAGQDK
jgi:hypothetical protein